MRYRIDRRNYPKQFKAGFLGEIQEGSFWEVKKDSRFRRRRRRRKILLVVFILAMLALLWGIQISIEGLKLFAVLPGSSAYPAEMS